MTTSRYIYGDDLVVGMLLVSPDGESILIIGIDIIGPDYIIVHEISVHPNKPPRISQHDVQPDANYERISFVVSPEETE